MKKGFLLIYFLIISIFAPADKKEPLKKSVVDYVNPLIGTLSTPSFSNGNTYPVIARPWGMNFWTPQTGKMGNGWIYDYTNPIIRGFKQTHQPSPWINDYGQFSVMPVGNWNKVNESERISWFSHKSEEVHPYYYSVYLADHDITCSLTTSSRAACFHICYPQSDQSGFIIDAYDKGSFIHVIDNYTIEGYSTRNSGGVGQNFKNWFVIRFKSPFIEFKLYDSGKPIENQDSCKGEHVIISVHFPSQKNEIRDIRIASSFISSKQAYQNLEEIGNKDFSSLVNDSKKEWDSILGRIEVKSENESQLQTFYSCLYRSVLFPHSLYEIDKNNGIIHYSPYTDKIEKGYLFGDSGFWDTFRALMPLLNLVYPDISKKIQESLLNVYRESHFFPEWSSPGHRDCMIGNNSASVIADAYLCGVYIQHTDEIFEGLLYSANNNHPTIKSTGRLGYKYYNQLGYIPSDLGINESVARTLEYAYDDWCIWKMGVKMNRPKEEIAIYKKRAQNYKEVFDAHFKLMRGKDSNGDFDVPFNPYKWGGVFTEGNAWHYTWSVFHDIKGLQQLMGGWESFISMLDSVFMIPPIYDDSYYGQRIHEITEMQVANMGNYAHGNQPAQHIAYLYCYGGQPWKTQYWVREIINRLYTPTPDGYCGDEDNGQTSAWYVFSACGFYPVCPASEEYVIGAPIFREITIHLHNGKNILIVNRNSDKGDNRYVDCIRVNGKIWRKNYFTYSQLNNGPHIKFKMKNIPNKNYRIDEQSTPYSMSDER